MTQFSRAHPNEFNQLIGQVPEEQRNVVQKYMQGQVDTSQLVA